MGVRFRLGAYVVVGLLLLCGVLDIDVSRGFNLFIISRLISIGGSRCGLLVGLIVGGMWFHCLIFAFGLGNSEKFLIRCWSVFCCCCCVLCWMFSFRCRYGWEFSISSCSLFSSCSGRNVCWWECRE